MDIKEQIQSATAAGLIQLFSAYLKPDEILVSPTKKEFEGDFTIVIFPLIKILKKNPQDIGEQLGNYLLENFKGIAGFNLVKGFLNLHFTPGFWKDKLKLVLQTEKFGHRESLGKKVLIEFSSPNTNKPLHLGHVRNILLGWSCAKLREARGYQVIKTQIVNDRGIAICKSMLAWKKFGNNSTPESEDIKGDKFVGEYYVKFEKQFQKEYQDWQASFIAERIYLTAVAQAIKPLTRDSFFKSFKNQYFNSYSQLGKEAKKMLIDWEAGKPEVIQLWEKLNGWVYEGFGETYSSLGIHFDHVYYESETYLLGKQIVEEGKDKELFYSKNDGSVWVNLEDVGLDEKIILRSDGTSVYLTQDLGTADRRYQDFGTPEMVYVVGNEQDYHFKVLFEVMKKMGRPYANGMFHLSYGMIELPEGKMKSREGTVVDADDFIEEVIQEAKLSADERGELELLSKEERERIYRQIGLGALKYFIIKVNPVKRMVFNPKESVDMQGQTGPYIQNAFVRIQSIMRKKEGILSEDDESYTPASEELALIRDITDYPAVLESASESFDPSGLANYCYTLAKGFHKFYHEFRILNAETPSARIFRLDLSRAVAYILQDGFDLLGIEMPQRM